jgi:uncharacterized protein (DUF433 family)
MEYGVMNYPHISSSPEICAGQPHIRGTRITVGLIAHEVESLRMSPDEVIAAHPHLSLAQVYAALAYYFDHQNEIQSAMQEAEEMEAELRERFPPRVQQMLALK